MRSFTCLTLAVLLCSSVPAFGEEPIRERVALLDFHVPAQLAERDPDLGRRLTALAAAELSRSFEVLDRAELLEALKSSEFSTPFTTASKAVALGRALGVSRLYVGLVLKAGKSTVVHLKGLDVGAGLFLGTEAVPWRDPASMAKAVEGLVERLHRHWRKPERPGDEDPDSARAKEQRWIKDLSAPTANARFAAAVELGKSGRKRAIPALAGVLDREKDYFVRRAAARSLGELDAWSAVPALIRAMADREFFVAETAHIAAWRITYHDFGFRDDLSRKELAAIVESAKEWWEAHKGDRTE